MFNAVKFWFNDAQLCWAAHPLNWHSTRQPLNALLETIPQAIFAQLFPSNSGKTFLIIFTMLLIVLFQLGLCGTVFQLCHRLGPRLSGLPAGQDPPPRMPGPPPHPHFSHLHVDLVGSLQYSNNFNYIFTIIDRTSKWMEAIPLSETSRRYA